ncbi:MAG: hypothetical protein IKF82_06070 [Bacilli bacterium]|nr:hypothetical protein [Bacilli bacterium]MBR3209814.1 hypothetical protein [Bacilli bacterium]
MNRKPLDFNSLPAVIQAMIEENTKAAAIIDELIEEKGETKSLALMIMLDDMNIRGAQIASLYKNCGQNINDFYEKILTIEKEDIDNINYESFATCKYKAIYNGSKEERTKNPEKYLFTDEERNDIRNIKNKDRMLGIVENTIKPRKDDLFPSIKKNEALSLINKHGFTCGYKKTYELDDTKEITYRVFYNEIGDIIYTYSLVNPDIFLWGECKLNAVRQTDNKKLDNVGCNAYKNIKGIVGYNIDLRKKPFETYEKVNDKQENPIESIKYTYYNNNLIPIIASENGIKYKYNNKDYKGLVTANIYDLLTFKETYYDLDEELKKRYSVLLSHAEDKAYDELIYQLNTDDGIQIALEIQNILGTKLEKTKLFAAKERFVKRNKNHFEIPKSKFLSDHVIEDPIGNSIEKRIMKIISYKETIKG